MRGMRFYRDGIFYKRCREVLVYSFVYLLAGVVAKDDVLDFQQNLPAQVIWAVQGKDVELPCDVTPPTPSDSVNMLFWFKDTSGIPLYSLDARGGPLGQAAHLAITDDLGSRSYFLTDGHSTKARLRIHNVQVKDEGVFRCRVDFMNSPTRNFRVNLTLVVQPSEPRIFDAQGREVVDNVGPFLEGRELFLSCQVTGGRPVPSVTWWQNDTLIDSVVDTTREAFTTVNQLFISRVSRSLRNSRFECRASASEMAGYRSRQVPIIVYLMPQKVKILTANELLSTRMPQLLRCETSGSYPPAKITWLLGNKAIRDASVTVSETEDSTTSILTLQATPEDDGKELVCRADNPRFPGGSADDSRTIRVAYPPKVSVHFMNDDGVGEQPMLKEGDRVRFRCKAKAMPPAYKYTWFHNGHLVQYNETAGTLPSDQTLELRRILKSSEGEYSCSAGNSEGEKQSEPLRLKVQYAPRCREGFESMEVGAIPHETVIIRCHVEAAPMTVKFSWTYNNSRDVLPVQGARVNNNGLTSQLYFTPGNGDLGTLACWASNSVGRQMTPCLFHLTPAKTPDPPRDCVFRHTCERCIEVICEAGEDGGLHQSFVLEVNEIAAPPELHHGSTTLSDQGVQTAPLLRYQENEPVFRLHTLQPGHEYQMLVYAVNAKGRSDPPVQLSNIVLSVPVDTIASSDTANLAEGNVLGVPTQQSLVMILVASVAIAALVVVGVITVVAVVMCKRRSNANSAGGAATSTRNRRGRTESSEDSKTEDNVELREASEHGFGESFQRRSIEWRERGIRASLYLHDPDGRTSQHISLGPDLILSPVSLPQQLQQHGTVY